MLVLRHALVLGTVALLMACHHDGPSLAITRAPLVVDVDELTSAQMPKSRSTDVSGGVAVSNEIFEACKLDIANVSEPPSSPGRTGLLDEDMSVLDRIAQCLTTGPLQGRQVILTGRAANDHTALGVNRAHTVSEYLSSRGVDTMRIRESSGGELDADRRVAITLK